MLYQGCDVEEDNELPHFAINLHPSIAFKWLEAERVYCFEIAALDHETTQSWVNATLQLINTWPEKQLVLGVLDFSQASGFAQLISLEKTIGQLKGIRPDLEGRVAVIVSRNMTSSILSFVTRKIPPQFVNREHRIFFETEYGLKWVMEIFAD